MDKKICKNCGREFISIKKYSDSEYCGTCRKYHKKCEICEKEIFVQARTCSKECAYELRKKSWRITCGSDHNFSKESISRKKWEKRLLIEEGIHNVFQREEVKEKSKQSHLKNLGVENPSQSETIKKKKIETCLKNYSVKGWWGLTEKVNETMLRIYGKKRLNNPEKFKETTRLKTRPRMEELGIWVPLSKLSEWEIYCHNVWEITIESIRKYGNESFINRRKNNKDKVYKEKMSIDHKYSTIMGFKNKISPEIIGSIVNLELLTTSSNSSKGKKCSISLQKLIHDYNIFLNENKNYKEN